MKILLIGPKPPPFGGTTVAFTTFTEGLREQLKPDDAITVVDTNVGSKRIISLAIAILKATRSCDIVSLHVGNRGALAMSPIVYFAAKLFQKKVITRKFGGVFDSYYESRNTFLRKLLDLTFFKSDVLLLETKALVNSFSTKHANTHWFPNPRTIPDKTVQQRDEKARLRVVFFGHVRKTKGVLELIEASKRLPDIDFDVYGPFYETLHESVFDGVSVTYRGVAEPEQVIDIMQEYDVFLLPTYYPGEGYPGAIIEAKVAGLAVMTSHWLSIPELIEDGADGIIVPPKDVDAIVAGLEKLDVDRKTLQRMKINSRQSSEKFDLKVWSKKFYLLCEQLTGK